MIKEIEKTLMLTLKSKIQTLSCDLSNVVNYVYSDKQKIIQILINLLTNAMRHSSHGETIHLVVENVNDNEIKFQVIDNGIGLTKTEIEQIFKNFRQLHALDSQACGLGLTITKKLIKLLDGTLSIDSEYGKGSNFNFTIKTKKYNEIIDTRSVLLKNLNVLVICKDVAIRMNLNSLLYDMKTNPIVCASHEEALYILEQPRHKFDACLFNLDKNTITYPLKLLKEKINKLNLATIYLVNHKTKKTIHKDDDSFILQKPINKQNVFKILTRIMAHKNLKNIKENESKHKSNKFKKILITDDVENCRLLLKDVLTNLGFVDIDLCDNATSTIDKINFSHEVNKPYDFLFLDLKIKSKKSDLNGLDVISYLRAKNYKLPKIIVVTASSLLHGEIKECQKLAVNSIVQKPIMIDEIENILNSF
jgi:CheY-like chemotaxis protein/anti-sigma regulatory factor (Ser/Thr protein kinase)